MIYKGNEEYGEVFASEVHGVSFYMPNNMSDGYHISRYVAAQAQSIYSSAGATKEVLTAMMDNIIELCNNTKKPSPTLRTDIALIANNILYRTRYPLDEDCAIRMGAIYTFLEGEDPKEANDLWTQKKIRMAHTDSNLYTFFLTTGARFTPQYSALLHHLNGTDYFQMRNQVLAGLTPQR